MTPKNESRNLFVIHLVDSDHLTSNCENLVVYTETLNTIYECDTSELAYEETSVICLFSSLDIKYPSSETWNTDISIVCFPIFIVPK